RASIIGRSLLRRGRPPGSSPIPRRLERPGVDAPSSLSRQGFVPSIGAAAMPAIIQRVTVRDQPTANVVAFDRTASDASVVLIAFDLDTDDRPTPDPVGQGLGRDQTATIGLTATSAKLCALRRIHAPDADPLSVQLES